MERKILLTKCIILLYRESLLGTKHENSAELVRSVLAEIKTSELGVSLNDEVIDGLKNLVLEMCRYPLDHIYDAEDLVQTLRICLAKDDKTFESLKDTLVTTITDSSCKRSVVNIRKRLTDFFKELKVAEILNTASYNFKFRRDSIKDVKEFVGDVISGLEPLQVSTAAKDPAVIGDIDLGDDASLEKLFKDIQDANKGTNVYKTGWKALNRMLQGGFRPGLTVIGALQHKYKTGFSLTLFKQIALYNKPTTQDKTKKPLLLRISFEDDLELNLQFLYQSLMYDETREKVDVKDLDVAKMSSYVKERLQVNGFHIKMLRVNPDQWTYMSVCNKIIELEAEGYNVEVLMLDYLSKLPTTGCTNTGSIGTDVCDLFSRLRNFTSQRGIVAITPHQLSTESKQLIRNGLPEDQFVKQVAGLGYYQFTKALDQVVDCEIFIHLFRHMKETYFSVQRGKLRIPTLTPEKDMYFLLKFPKSMPIPDDREDEDQSIPRLSAISTNADDALFDI